MEPSYQRSEPHMKILRNGFYCLLMSILQFWILEYFPHTNKIVGYLAGHLNDIDWTPNDETGTQMDTICIIEYKHETLTLSAA